jgi:peptidyl-prolyl cis-trans isomerase D
MLRQIREKTGSLVVKLILFLLVISFGAWGIGDMIQFRGDDRPVAEVAGTELSRQTVEVEVRREMARLNPRFGGQLNQQTARLLGLPQSVLGQMVNDILLTEAAKDLDIAISDDIVRDAVRSSNAFRSALGAGGFDRQKFQNMLYQFGLTEQQFLERARRELARGQLLDTVEAGVAAPKILAETFYRYREETRKAETLFITDDAAQIAAEPTDAELRTYHKDNPGPFTAPEYRAVTLALLRASDLEDPASVTDADVEQAFADKQDSLGTPETRTLSQMILPDQDAADKAAKALAEGRPFEDVAKELAGMDAAATDLGTVTRDAVLEEIAAAAFAANAGSVTAPLPGPGGIGFYIVKVRDVTPAKKVTLAEVKEKLRADIARERAIDALYSQVNRFEDDLGKGVSIEAAAEAMGIKATKVAAMDAQGTGRDGKPVAGLGDAAGAIAASAFETEEGTDSTLRELGDDAFFVVRVDSVIKPELRAFETVKEQVKAAVLAERKRDAALNFATQLADRLKAGESADAVAKEAGAVLAETKELKRYLPQTESGIPGQLLQDIFSVKKGETKVTRGAGGYFVSRVTAVTPADPKADTKGVEGMQQELAGLLRDDLVTQLAGALRADMGVTINQDVLRKVLDTGAAQAN